jgi:hypothetical protein
MNMRTQVRSLGLAALLVAGGAGAAEEWDTVETKPITIKVRERPDGNGKDVWAEGTLKAEARDVQAALLDQDSYRLWMPYVKESRVVSTGADGSRVTYTRLDLPVVASRDYVCQVTNESLLAADGTGRFHQRWGVVEDKEVPKRRGVVRLPRNEGSWVVTPKGEGQSHAVYKFSVDPGGSLPGFLASFGQKGGVLDTWKAVEKRAALLKAEREKPAPAAAVQPPKPEAAPAAP